MKTVKLDRALEECMRMHESEEDREARRGNFDTIFEGFLDKNEEESLLLC